MSEVNTIISNKHISFLMSTKENYICCTLPRYDTYLFSQAIKESINQNNSVSFETTSMTIEIVNLVGNFIINCINKATTTSFQFVLSNGIEVAEALETAAIKGNKEFGNPLEKNCKWGFFSTLPENK